jgi:predicted adenylyl cyclase CyaB
MPSNVEIKSRLSDRRRVEELARQLSDSTPQLIQQEDIFFSCDGARLKLRILAPNLGELIRYQRSDLAAARSSHYSIARTADPRILLDILSRTLGQLGTVRKTRTLYLIGQTRLHFDQVENLGDFLELEVVLRPGQDESDGQRIAYELMAKLGIEPRHLIAEAYIDLLVTAPRLPS